MERERIVCPTPLCHFPIFLTHHLKAIRRCESSFTTENLAKINFLHLFLALVRKSKCDRLHSFCPPSSSSIVFLYLFWTLNVSDVYFWAHVHVLIACDVGGIYPPHMSRIVCCCRLMCTHGHVPMCRMHVHTLTLHVRKLCGGVDVSLCEACVCDTASLWLHLYPVWQIADRRRVQQQVMGGWGTGSYCPWLSHHIDLPPSYLAPAKTHSSVLTRAYYTSSLPGHTTKSEQSSYRQVERFHQVSHWSLGFHWWGGKVWRPSWPPG